MKEKEIKVGKFGNGALLTCRGNSVTVTKRKKKKPHTQSDIFIYRESYAWGHTHKQTHKQPSPKLKRWDFRVTTHIHHM